MENIFLVGKAFNSIERPRIYLALELIKAENLISVGQVLGTSYQHLIRTNIIVNGEKVCIRTVIAFVEKPSNMLIKNIMDVLGNGEHIQVMANMLKCDDIGELVKCSVNVDFSNSRFREILKDSFREFNYYRTKPLDAA